MTTFDVKSALIRAELSNAAYTDDEKSLSSKVNDIGYELIEEIGADNKVGGYICRNCTEAIIVFRGTHNKCELFEDIKACIGTTSNNAAHTRFAAGFYDAYEKLQPEFLPIIQALDVPVHVTGHSLGGAMAMIAKAMIPYIKTCYAIAPANIAGRLQLTDTWRIVHESDIVPNLPIWIFPFTLAWPFNGETVYLSDKGLSFGFKAHLMRAACLIKPIIGKAIFDLPEYIEDHACELYIQDLSREAAK